MGWLLLGCVMSAGPVRASEAAAKPAPPSPAFRAMNILRDQCISCHDAGKRKGDLDLGTRETLFAGGSEGAVVTPGKSGESRLISYLLPDAETHMPPKGQLSDDEIQTLREWIDAGLPWDAEGLRFASGEGGPVAFGKLPDSYRPVFALAISPDQSRLAAGRGATILIYDLSPPATIENPIPAEPPTPTPIPSPTPKPAIMRKITAHEDAVRSITWSPDGKLLASGSHGRIALHDAVTWEEAGMITEGIEDRVTALVFSPDSALLYSADGAATRKGWIKRWNARTRERAGAWEAHTDEINALAIDAAGTRLYSAGVDGLIRQWDAAAGMPLNKYEGHTGHVLSLALHPDGKVLASGGADHQVKMWDIETTEQKITISGHPSAVTALQWTGAVENQRLVSAGEDGVVRISTGDKETPERSFGKASEVLYAVAADATGHRFFAGAHDGRIYAWDADGKQPEMLDASEPAAGTQE